MFLNKVDDNKVIYIDELKVFGNIEFDCKSLCSTSKYSMNFRVNELLKLAKVII